MSNAICGIYKHVKSVSLTLNVWGLRALIMNLYFSPRFEEDLRILYSWWRDSNPYLQLYIYYNLARKLYTLKW